MASLRGKSVNDGILALFGTWLRPFCAGQVQLLLESLVALHAGFMAEEAPLFAALPIHADQRKGEGLAIYGALWLYIVSAQ